MKIITKIKIEFISYYFPLFIMFYIIPILKSIRYLKVFNLISEDILLITDENIIKYNIDSKDKYIILYFNYTINQNNIDLINFAQYPSNNEGYFLCRIQQYIYIISNKNDSLIRLVSLDEIEDKYISIISYKSPNSLFYCIINYINDNNTLISKMYSIYEDPNIQIGKIEHRNHYYYEDYKRLLSLDVGISCEIMNSYDKDNILICFVENKDNNSLVAIAFNPEQGMNILYTISDTEINEKITFIKSITNADKNRCLLCYYNYTNSFRCLLYNSYNNTLTNAITFYHHFSGEEENNFNVNYNRENEDYLVLFNYQTMIYKLIEYDGYNLYNETEKFCLIMNLLNNLNISNIYSNILFNKNKYYLLLAINDSINFTLYEIEEHCNILYNFDVLNITSFQSLFSYITSSTSIPSLSSSLLTTNLSKTSVSSSSILPYFKDIEIMFDGYIGFGKINQTKEEIENNLDKIMEIIELKKKYLICGDNFNISISPIKDINTFQSTYADLSLCEDILREKYKLPSDEILTVMQIEIDKMNENSLTNQLEYAIYNEKKEKLDLSYCKNLEIIVHYNIKNISSLNKTMISYYSELGIDIFNINDSFFSDICYSFSISDSDIILKDRVLDIYQNYSLCDHKCNYDNIDLESNSISCLCQIKTEIDVDIESPNFDTVIKDTFRDSNFGVFKCYKLIFNLKNKLDNIGFWIFLFFTICHIPIFIHYFIHGLKPIYIFNNNNIKKIFNKEESNKITINNNKLNKINIYKNKKKNKHNSISSMINSFKINNNKKIKSNIRINNNRNNKYIKEKQKYNLKSNNKDRMSSFKANRSSNLILSVSNKFNNESKINTILYDKNYNLDIYNYEKAEKNDKRSFWRIYYICLLSKVRILNTFVLKSPLEIKSLRISLFLFNYSCDFALNAFFYSNQKISDKYHYTGNNLLWFSLINNLLISFSSALFSIILVGLLNILTNSKREIKMVFKQDLKNNSNSKKIVIKTLLKIYFKLKIKIICYIILEFLIILFFFYYVTGFCIIYKETQFNWLLDSIVSFLLSIIIKLIISFIITIFYFISLKFRLRVLYNIIIFIS